MRNSANPILLLWIILVIFSCVQNTDFEEISSLCVENQLASNATFTDVKQLYKEEIIQIQEDLIIEAYVASSDASGNIFGSIYVQNNLQNPTDGLQIDIDLRQSHLFFGQGQKVLINLKGLYLDGSCLLYTSPSPRDA